VRLVSGLIIASLIFNDKNGRSNGGNVPMVKPLLKEKAWADEDSFLRALKASVFYKHIKRSVIFSWFPTGSDFNTCQTNTEIRIHSIIRRIECNIWISPTIRNGGIF